MAQFAFMSAVKTSISATSDSSSSLMSVARCANSSSVSTLRVPNRAGRWSGTPTISTPGQNPWMSGSPHGVFGWTKPAAGWGMGSAAALAVREGAAPPRRWAATATDAETNATRTATSDLFMACSGVRVILRPPPRSSKPATSAGRRPDVVHPGKLEVTMSAEKKATRRCEEWSSDEVIHTVESNSRSRGESSDVLAPAPRWLDDGPSQLRVWRGREIAAEDACTRSSTCHSAP